VLAADGVVQTLADALVHQQLRQHHTHTAVNDDVKLRRTRNNHPGRRRTCMDRGHLKRSGGGGGCGTTCSSRRDDTSEPRTSFGAWLTTCRTRWACSLR
jgi:hypothetical protein